MLSSFTDAEWQKPFLLSHNGKRGQHCADHGVFEAVWSLSKWQRHSSCSLRCLPSRGLLHPLFWPWICCSKGGLRSLASLRWWHTSKIPAWCWELIKHYSISVACKQLINGFQVDLSLNPDVLNWRHKDAVYVGSSDQTASQGQLTVVRGLEASCRLSSPSEGDLRFLSQSIFRFAFVHTSKVHRWTSRASKIKLQLPWISALPLTNRVPIYIEASNEWPNCRELMLTITHLIFLTFICITFLSGISMLIWSICSSPKVGKSLLWLMNYPAEMTRQEVSRTLIILWQVQCLEASLLDICSSTR